MKKPQTIADRVLAAVPAEWTFVADLDLPRDVIPASAALVQLEKDGRIEVRAHAGRVQLRKAVPS